MTALLIALNILAGLFLIGVVLLQSGKGADMGAAFGGASSTVFGASGAGNVLTKITAGTAAVFMGTSLALAVVSTRDRSVFDDIGEPAPVTAPAPAAVPEIPGAGPAAGAGAPDQPFAATDGVDAKAPAEARGQEPLVADDTDVPDEAAPRADLGPAGQAEAPAGAAEGAAAAPEGAGAEAVGEMGQAPQQAQEAEPGTADAPAAGAADSAAADEAGGAGANEPAGESEGTDEQPAGDAPAAP